MPVHHRITRKRPIDATGIFWALVCLAFGYFLLWLIPVAGIAVLAAVPLCSIYQIWTWRNEYSAKQAAMRWCDTHFSSETDLPLVDFMTSLSLYARCDLETVKPSTRLDEIFELHDDDWIDLTENEWNQMWLETVF